MRIAPKDKKIELYKEGFGRGDILNRRELSEQLSDLVERIEDPLVVALNGSWGSGKS